VVKSSLRKLTPHGIKRAIQRKQITKIRAEREAKINNFIEKRRFDWMVKFGTAMQETYVKLGRSFIEKFNSRTIGKKNDRTYLIQADELGLYDSARQVQIICQEGKENNYLGHLSLGFTKSGLIIEAIQGTMGKKQMQREFWRLGKKPIFEFMLHEIEEHAKKLGFRYIKIRRPETLYYYKKPYLKTKSDKEIRRSMRILYDKVARHAGYKKEEFYYTKAL
jgi:hypothetical protein